MSLSRKSRLCSLPSQTSCGLASSFDEERWVIQIRRALDEEEVEDDMETPVCIFSVPKSLLAFDSDSYIPQEVAIGPYHYWRPELYEMERYKIAAAKRAQKQLQCLKFHNLVEQLMKHEQKIRACYHKYLDFNSETFAWTMAIDASFLLEVLRVYTLREEKTLPCISSKLSYLVDCDGRKSVHNAILRDIIKLENQIPLFVLRKILELQFSAREPANEVLLSMLLGLYKDLSPFKIMEVDSLNLKIQISVSKCFHLLDFLYQMIVPILSDSSDIIGGEQNQRENEIWTLLLKFVEGLTGSIKKILSSRPLQIIFTLPWTIISRHPGFAILVKPLECLCLLRNGLEENEAESGSSGSEGKINRLPLLEEITIPSVSQLAKSGVDFSPIEGGISAIAFDTKNVVLYLPSISLDVNSEVLLRNLVAYEASKASGSLAFTRFVELINGIVDSEDDVKLLKEKGIIMNHLKSDSEVAELWNGMSKSIKMTNVPFLDKIIDDVNKYYNGRWEVKATKLVNKYVFSSWPSLALLATILLLIMTALQAFCSIFRCHHK